MSKQNEAFESIARMSTATISDALFRLGYKRFTMQSKIKPIEQRMRLAGPAFTAKAYPGGTYICEKALEEVKEGEVIVIDGGGFLDAVLWGEIFSRMALKKGVQGVVIDGAVRDIDKVIEMGFPLFAAGIVPAAGTSDKLGETGISINCAGVVVTPGDWIFGDILGVVVVPDELLLQTRKSCEEVLRKEYEMLKKIQGKKKG